MNINRHTCVLAIIMALLIPATTLSQLSYYPPTEYKRQAQLVDSLRSFMLNDLKLDIPKDYYEEFEELKDSMYVFLYISLPDYVGFDSSLPYRRYYDLDSAIQISNKLKMEGYHTLVYKTAGMSNGHLNRKLLSYADEAIAFIIFHEATHYVLFHLPNASSFPYQYNEALCDVMANEACIKFAEKTKLLCLPDVLKQKRIFETAYAFINNKRIALDAAKSERKPAIFKTCTAKMERLTKNANQFQKDRLRYEVNNAYFLRYQDYAMHYFEIQQHFPAGFNLPAIANKILSWQKQK